MIAKSKREDAKAPSRKEEGFSGNYFKIIPWSMLEGMIRM